MHVPIESGLKYIASRLRTGKAAGVGLVQQRAGSNRSDGWLGPSPKPATTAGDPWV